MTLGPLEVAMVKPQTPAAATGRTVSELMSEPGAVVERSAHLAAAAYLMRHTHRPELIVVEDQASRTPVGTITSFDIVRAVSHAGDPSEETVGAWESPDAKVVHPGTPLREALDLMLDQTLPFLPVVDDDNELVGVIDLIRLTRALRSLLED
jgi:CBS domain-containing protein